MDQKETKNMQIEKYILFLRKAWKEIIIVSHVHKKRVS